MRVLHFDEGFLRLGAYDVDGWRVLELDGFTEVAIGVHFGGQLALRVDHER